MVDAVAFPGTTFAGYQRAGAFAALAVGLAHHEEGAPEGFTAVAAIVTATATDGQEYGHRKQTQNGHQ